MPRRFLNLSLVLCSLSLYAEPMTIDFDDLPHLLDASSPILEQYSAGVDLAKAELRTGRQWSNPDLTYSREYIVSGGFDETEEMVYIGKTIEMPWTFHSKKKSLALNVEAAELYYLQNVQQVYAETRSLYVRLKLVENLLQQQADVKAILHELSRVVKARSEEGALALLEANLLSTGLFALSTDIVNAQQEYDKAIIDFKQMLGIDPDDEVTLTTTVNYADVSIEKLDVENAILRHTGLQAQGRRVAVFDQRVSLEKGRMLSSMTILGGYKHINREWEGYTAGLSLPMPILSLNRGQVEQMQIERRIEETQRRLYEQELRAEMERLIRLIESRKSVLGDFHRNKMATDMVENLAAAYKEGALSLAEFLNALQLHRDGSRRYTEQLIAYYEAVFQLEVLNGQQLIAF